MRKGDWIALGVIAAAAYLLVKSKAGGGTSTSVDVVSGNAIVGFLDQTQKVQYDPATGNLWDVSGQVNQLIATIQPGRDGSVFADPAVQALIVQAGPLS